MPAYSSAGAHEAPPLTRVQRRRQQALVRRRRRLTLLLLLVLSATLVGYDLSRASAPPQALAGTGPGGPGRAPYPSPAPAPRGLPSGAAASPRTAASPQVGVVNAAHGTFSYARGDGAVAGSSGAIQRYRVAVEDGVGVSADAFGSAVEAILSDPRSWIAGDVRLQRVGSGTPATFTVFLASPATSERMCASDGLSTDQFTNCRLSDDRVVINSARWLTAVPDYGAPLDVYRAYAVNHEVGHQLGYGHELCPGAGQPAPVMQQQTLGLQGCVANGWPYIDGVRYSGPPGEQ
jgi:hypothetical protein